MRDTIRWRRSTREPAHAIAERIVGLGEELMEVGLAEPVQGQPLLKGVDVIERFL